ncbi:hypothetical protein D3Z45_03215 [Lachnospiraceae bacterium]|nr:hypothetical protein [Lachnospiraceae bacterium]
MVFVKIVKKEGNKTTQETLDLKGNDAIYISDNDYNGYLGFKLTQEDLIFLFSRKKAQGKVRIEAQKTAQEKQIEEKLQKNQGMGSGTGTPKQQISYAPFKEVEKIKQLPGKGICVILSIWENHRAKGGFTPLIFRRVQVALQTKERRAIQCMLHIRI